MTVDKPVFAGDATPTATDADGSKGPATGEDSPADTAGGLTDNLEAAVEAMLFVSDDSVSAAALARVLGRSPSEVDAALSGLALRLEEEERGIQLREVAGGWRLYTHPAFHELIEGYVLSWDTRSLSQAALEALAVIAYHQPCSRQTINGIRGVNSEGVVASLVEKGLVREAGRDPGPGSAILYATTRSFLEKFGLKSLKELPPLTDFAPDEASREFIKARLSSEGIGPAEEAAQPQDTPECLPQTRRQPRLDG
jgi:segregation and condensation protein B